MKQLVALLSLFVVLALGMPTSVYAANLKLIETKVVENAATRQQQRTKSAQTHTPEASVQVPTALHSESSTSIVHWSILQGALMLRTIDGQLYLHLG